MLSIPKTANVLEPLERSPGYWTTVLRRFSRDPVAVFALIVILLLRPNGLFGEKP